MIELRNHQVKAVLDVSAVLYKYKVALLFGEMRTGKTAVGLQLGFYNYVPAKRRTLVLTKKKAISGIKDDARKFFPDAWEDNWVHVINYESAHKIPAENWGFIILDESHSSGLAKYPQFSKTWKTVREIIRGSQADVLLMSGTPCIETAAQLYPQFAVTGRGPWAEWSTYYRFWQQPGHYKAGRSGGYGIAGAVTYIAGGQTVADYSKVDAQRILDEATPYIVGMTRKEAGFKVTDADVRGVSQQNEALAALVRTIQRDGIIEVTDEDGQQRRLTYESAAQRLQAAHMVAGGTLIETKIKLATVKGQKFPKKYAEAFILAHKYDPTYRAREIDDRMDPENANVIFTQYIKERDLLLDYFGARGTDDLDELKAGNAQVAVLSLTSYSMGVNLAWVKGGIFFYSLNWSGAIWSQVLDRPLRIDREDPAEVHVFLLNHGVDLQVFKAINSKQDFNLSVYERIQNPSGRD